MHMMAGCILFGSVNGAYEDELWKALSSANGHMEARDSDRAATHLTYHCEASASVVSADNDLATRWNCF